jgi:preprotein translocase subunit SecD
MARSIVAAAWCGVAALALAGCAGSDGGTKQPVATKAPVATNHPVAGSFEIRAVSAEANLSELPAGAECTRTPLALSESGWVCDAATFTGYLVEPASIDAGDVAEVTQGPNGQPGSTNWAVRVTFTAAGAAAFEELTSEVYVAKPPANKVALLVDGEPVSAPFVREPITGGTLEIGLKGGEAEAKAMAAAIVGSSG